jgi:hypothetical protein
MAQRATKKCWKNSTRKKQKKNPDAIEMAKPEKLSELAKIIGSYVLSELHQPELELKHFAICPSCKKMHKKIIPGAGGNDIKYVCGICKKSYDITEVAWGASAVCKVKC